MFDDNRKFETIRRKVGKAIGEHLLISDGDRIAIGVSGGKDSWTLLFALESLRRRAPVKFTLHPVTVDSGFPGFQAHRITEFLHSIGMEHELRSTNAFAIIEEKKEERDSYCSFCARMRRGFLTTAALDLNCNKIALGHHLDDFAETLLLNLFYAGNISAMPAIYKEERGTEVIRPLLHVHEEEIIDFIHETDAPVICCACPVCGQIDQKRKRMKRLLRELNTEIPNLLPSLDNALGNVHPERFPLHKKIGGSASEPPQGA